MRIGRWGRGFRAVDQVGRQRGRVSDFNGECKMLLLLNVLGLRWRRLLSFMTVDALTEAIYFGHQPLFAANGGLNKTWASNRISMDFQNMYR